MLLRGRFSLSLRGCCALRSTLPFCYDSLAFEEWLQWIFLPQMRHLLSVNGALPPTCAIAPMAEIAFMESLLDTARLLEVLNDIDAFITSLGNHRQ